MNHLKPDWLCCQISPQPTLLLPPRVLPPALHSQCCAAALLLLLQFNVQTQEKTSVLLLAFCNVEVAQSSSSKCWGLRRAGITHPCCVMTAGVVWAGLVKCIGFGVGSATSRAGKMREGAGIEVWGKDWRIRPPHPWWVRCNLGAVCHLMAAATKAHSRLHRSSLFSCSELRQSLNPTSWQRNWREVVLLQCDHPVVLSAAIWTGTV